ncbi:MAG: hypothetical protein A3A33_04940 [Candidatus Yanofskybacteria bacterium RIFCSPLOWO2_01_FULL_49_25]|uniref:Uncharacterized protein n=1 Tax=Candidatus Yanofskybacteria bacterium RIFCSPLOWO2_01_FULL_49_25 TaxID=1802701 RepID=A0A1F8GQ20_9BACT|nr:MAG: hypothetical protein A3A33_04940 [Candidatus Yanofskybacteria bacterium RIFCSPLOWO2_01_FULL_49_25]
MQEIDAYEGLEREDFQEFAEVFVRKIANRVLVEMSRAVLSGRPLNSQYHSSIVRPELSYAYSVRKQIEYLDPGLVAGFDAEFKKLTGGDEGGVVMDEVKAILDRSE